MSTHLVQAMAKLLCTVTSTVLLRSPIRWWEAKRNTWRFPYSYPLPGITTTAQGGTGPFTTEIWTHICSCHYFFTPFFCADNFDIRLLLIVCASRWYIKCLYRYLFLEVIAKHARVTQKRHFLIWNKSNSKAPWPTAPKLVLWVANTLSCDMTCQTIFNRKHSWVTAPRRGGVTDIQWFLARLEIKCLISHQHFTAL